MKRWLLLLLVAGAVGMGTGCHHFTCANCSRGCGPGHRRAERLADRVPRVPHGDHRQLYQGPYGPPTPAVAYPYYTVRAPRDFLLDNPPPLGY